MVICSCFLYNLYKFVLVSWYIVYICAKQLQVVTVCITTNIMPFNLLQEIVLLFYAVTCVAVDTLQCHTDQIALSGSSLQLIVCHSVGKEVLENHESFAKLGSMYVGNTIDVCFQALTCFGLNHSPLLQRRSSRGCLWTKISFLNYSSTAW